MINTATKEVFEMLTYSTENPEQVTMAADTLIACLKASGATDVPPVDELVNHITDQW